MFAQPGRMGRGGAVIGRRNLLPASARYNVAAVPGLVADWDYSHDAARSPPDEAAITSLSPRVGIGALTAAADGGGTVPVGTDEAARYYGTFVGGNNQRRLDAPIGVADNLFAGGGMLTMALRNGNQLLENPVLLGKWNGVGWIIFFFGESNLAFEVYSATGDVRFNIPCPVNNRWYTLEIEWDADVPAVSPIARVDGVAQFVSVQLIGGAGLSSVNDSSAALCVGNRNWGSLATPWSGQIGEILAFSQIPTTEQKDAIRADLMAHWNNPPDHFATGAISTPMLTMAGASTFPYTQLNPTTGAATSGDGTITPTATDVSVAYGTTTTSARFSHNVQIGQRYRLTWEQSGTTGGQSGFGTAAGGSQYRPPMAPVQGFVFDFTATTTTLWINFQRTSAGTTTFSNILITPIAEVAWTDITPSLINKAGWIVTGAVTVDGTTGAITIPATGTSLSARQGILSGLTQGTLYRLRWVNNSNTTMALLGISNGNGTMKTSGSSDPVGSRTYEFTPQGSQTWVQFQRTSNGTAIVSDIEFQQVT